MIQKKLGIARSIAKGVFDYRVRSLAQVSLNAYWLFAGSCVRVKSTLGCFHWSSTPIHILNWIPSLFSVPRSAKVGGGWQVRLRGFPLMYILYKICELY